MGKVMLCIPLHCLSLLESEAVLSVVKELSLSAFLQKRLLGGGIRRTGITVNACSVFP